MKKWFRRLLYRGNPKHKDRLFCTIFGKEKYKKYALQLYNALNGSSYTSLSDLEIITLEDAVYIRMKNDVAYLVFDNMAVYEHQSTINENMPVRGFMYFGELYSKWIKRNKCRIYNSRLIKIPTPQFIVFYNGREEYPEVSKMRLSDAFINPRDDGEFEWTATVYNINAGKNPELLEACEPLRWYADFVDRIRIFSRNMSLEEAVDKAVRECIDEGVLADVLSEERAAAMLEAITTFDEKLYEEGLREEGREEGRKEGREEGREEGRKEGREEMRELIEAKNRELESIRAWAIEHGYDQNEIMR